MTAGIPPTVVATTGSPSAIASTMTRPMPSFREGTTTTSAATRCDGTSAVSPVRRTRSVTPSDAASAARPIRSGPSPTSKTRVEEIWALTLGSAPTRRSKPLIRMRRPRPTMTKAFSSSPSRVRAWARDGAAARSRSVGTPLGTVTYCSGRPMPCARCSTVPRSVRVMIRSVHLAARRSSAVKKAVRRGL